MPRPISLVQFWGGTPQGPNSKWQRFVRLIEASARRGWRTALVWSALPEDPELVRPFREMGCRIVVQPRPAGNFDARCVAGTYRLLRDVQCDVFHCHNVHTSPLIAAALAGVPVRVWSKLSMSREYEQGEAARGLSRFAPSVRASCCLAQRVLAVSGPVRRELLGQGVSASRVSVLHMPVDLEQCARAKADGVRTGLGLAPDDVVITAVGHAVPVKGWDVLVAAFAAVAPRFERARLVLVGGTTGPDEVVFAARLRATIAEHGLESRVRFTGHRGDVLAILRASDIFVAPSRSDGLGLALTEAMAIGLPCIGARTGGIPDLVTDGGNGLLFARESSAELADRLVRLIQDRPLRTALGEQARKSVQCLGFDGMTRAVMRLYDRLLAKQTSVARRAETV